MGNFFISKNSANPKLDVLNVMGQSQSLQLTCSSPKTKFRERCVGCHESGNQIRKHRLKPMNERSKTENKSEQFTRRQSENFKEKFDRGSNYLMETVRNGCKKN